MSKYTKLICGKFYDGLKPVFQENMEILICDKFIKETGHKLNCP